MARKYEKKDIELKYALGEQDAEAGTFTGYLSIFGVVDSYGDMVVPGAFKKTIREKKEFPLLWSHDLYTPIGLFTAAEDEKGLLIAGQLNLDVARAKEIRSLMAQGAVKGLSIGYRVVKELIDRDNGVRQLKEIDLWEGSPCVFQACPDAEVNEVKSIELKRYPHEHSARLQEPSKFDEFRRKADGKLYNSIKVPDTIDIIWGHIKDGADDEWAAQAIRFPVKDWTEKEAKAWLKDNEVKYIDFEPAKEPEKSTPDDSKPEIIHLLDGLIFRL